ncbi:MAG: DUF6105 family protein [Nitratireductor sp.]|jgi:hypothetical protein|nr:DUF6105 family protein [Nitratireductor sp.]
MRVILTLWALPLAFFWGWYALSANDISFGTVFFSRELHDAVFGLYGRTLGIPPQELPGMLAWACILDTGIILAIAAFRWRARWLPRARMEAGRIREALFPSARNDVSEAAPADRVLPAE